MTDLSGALGGAAGGVLGGVGDLLNGVLGGATQVVAQAGDTLATIADAHGVPLSTVVAANPQVLHPDLVQPGQAISVPQAGPDAPAAPAPNASASPGSGQGLGESLGQTVQAVGQTVGQAVGQAVGPSLPPGAGLAPRADGATPAGPAQGASTPAAEPGPAPIVSAPGNTVGQGAPDFRVLMQTSPPLAQPLTPASGPLAAAPTLMQALARIDPSLSQLLAGALSAPTLSAPASPSQLDRLETALLSLGWAAVSLGLAKPGDVVLLLRTAMLQAARVPAEGLVLSAQGEADGSAAASTTRALSPPQGTPPGIDVAAPQRLRGRKAGDDAAKASDRHGGQERDSPQSPQRAWIARALPTAIAVKARWGVPVAVTLAQGALVSDWGRLAPGNDFFGLRDRRPAQPASVAAEGRALTVRPPAPSAFGDVDEAAEAFGAFVSQKPVFARAFRAPDARTFARRLAEGGYSGDPDHGDRLVDIIDTYDLNALDG